MIAAKILMLILSNEGHWFGGQAGTISAQWAAQFEQPEAVLKWDLLIGEVRVAGDQLAVQRGSKASVVTVTPPEVRVRTRMRWVYRLYQRGDGKEIDTGETVVQVYPVPKADRLKGRLRDRRIAVWDTAGGLADTLAKAGLEFKRIRKAADLQLSRVDVVLVGPNELRDELFDQSPLIALAEAGAGVVLFEQRHPRSLAGYPLMRRTAAIRPTWRSNHPLISGLEVDDMQSWLDGPGKEIWAVELPADAGPDFARIVADFDEPFADPSAFPTWYLARETTRQVKVVLSGDGGDELFAGYKRYEKHLRTRWRSAVSLPWLAQPAAPGSRGGARLVAELSMDWQHAYSLRFSGFSPGQRRFLQQGRALRRPTWWRMPDGGDYGLADGGLGALACHDGGDALRQLLQIDMLNYLPEYILRKSDLATMAHGLEARAPLLDHRLYEAVLAMPAGVRFTRPPKRLLGQALRLPPDIDLFAGKKRGFNPPLEQMLRHSLADRLPGLGERLAGLTSRQLGAAPVNQFVGLFQAGDGALAEQVLQLVILDESLGQLQQL